MLKSVQKMPDDKRLRIRGGDKLIVEVILNPIVIVGRGTLKRDVSTQGRCVPLVHVV